MTGNGTELVFAENATISVEDVTPHLEIPPYLYGALMSLTFKVNLPRALCFGLNIAITCISVLANSFLLVSTAKVDNHVLKCKRFIQSNAVSNIVLPVATIINMPFLADAFKVDSLGVQICFSAFYWMVFGISIFVQAICGAGLACDRLYAVVRPLDYHTSGYNKWFKGVMAAFPWVISVAIWLGFVIYTCLKPIPEFYATPSICMILYITQDIIWKIGLLDIFQLVTNFASMFVYIGIFFSIRYKRKSAIKMMSTVEQKSRSLVITYFLTNTTTLVLFTPAPLYSLLTQHYMLSSQQNRDIFMTTIRFLFSIYLCNSFFSPIILFLRIKSLREKLPFSLKSKPRVRSSNNKPSQSTKETSPETPQI